MTDAASFNPDLSLSFAGVGCRSFNPKANPALRLRLFCMFLPPWSLFYAKCFPRCSSLIAISGFRPEQVRHLVDVWLFALVKSRFEGER